MEAGRSSRTRRPLLPGEIVHQWTLLPAQLASEEKTAGRRVHCIRF